MYLVESRLREVVVETGCASFGEFYHKAKGAGPTLRDRIIDDMTTNETSWFRDMTFWETVRQVIIPESVERAQQRRAATRSRSGPRPARPARSRTRSGSSCARWSARASCAATAPSSFDILATDISRDALSIAEAGRYDPISMHRGLEPLRLASATSTRAAASRSCATRREEARALQAHEPARLVRRTLGAFDIVMLRNVLIYFAARLQADTILAKATEVLRREGALVAGATETLELYSDDFDVVRHGRSTFYRVKEV